MSEEYRLVIHDRAKNRFQFPRVIENVQWETERVGSAGKLTFTVVKTEDLGFHEGDTVQFTKLPKEKEYNPATKKMEVLPDFQGYIFSKHRNKKHHIEVVAYDQLRFLKNQRSYLMENVRADQVIKRIADDLNLVTRDLPNTGYVIPKLAMSNQTCLDTIQWTIDETLKVTGKRYCLYDDAGYLAIRDMKSEHTGVVISEETAEDFDYTSSIDTDTYNQIIVVNTDTESGGDRVIEQDTRMQELWGGLSYRVESSGIKNPKEYARNLLNLYNRVSRSLEIKGQIGNINVRAGTRIKLILYLGDKNVNWDMIVDKATHYFSHCRHSMDLKLIGHEEWYD